MTAWPKALERVTVTRADLPLSATEKSRVRKARTGVSGLSVTWVTVEAESFWRSGSLTPPLTAKKRVTRMPAALGRTGIVRVAVWFGPRTPKSAVTVRPLTVIGVDEPATLTVKSAGLKATVSGRIVRRSAGAEYSVRFLLVMEAV